MRTAALVATLALGCGRVGFDPPDERAGDGGADGGDATTGEAGWRFLHALGPVSFPGMIVTGARGELVAIANFQTSLAIDGGVLTGRAMYTSAAVVRYDATGTQVSASILDSPSICEMRGAAMRGDDVIASGFVNGGDGDASYGACNHAAGRQSPIEVRVDRTGAQTFAAFWAPTGGANAQGWRTAAFSDGTYAMSGIYGAGVTIGMPLPAAGTDPTVFVTRFAEAATTPVWAKGVSSPSVTWAGPLATDGDELCMLGAHGGAVTLFGTALPFLGGQSDAWVARFDAAGNARWIHPIGTAGDEAAFGEGGVAVAPNGGCFAAIEVPRDITIDGFTLPVAAGVGTVLQFDATGTVVAATRSPRPGFIAVAGGRLFTAFDTTVPVPFDTMTYTPQGRDIVIAEITPTGAMFVGAIGGTGDQVATSFVAIASDALGIGGGSTGDLEFRGVHTSSAAQINIAAVIGL